MVDCNGHSDSEFHKGGRNAGGVFSPKGKDVNMWRVLPRWLTVLVMLEASYSIIGSDVEGDALFKFLRAVNDSYRPTTDWNLNSVSPCFSWSHVVCKDGHVVSLNLASNGFSGTFSPSITKLKFLISLDLQDNNVSGVLPDYLSSLTQLQYLNLGHNNFDGSIPTTWNRLPNLKHLDLSSNNLTGRIPRQLFLIPTYNFTGTHLACGSSVQKPCVSSSSLAVPTRQKKLGTLPIVACCGAFALLLLGVIFIYIHRHVLKSEQDLFIDVEGEDELNISLGQLRRFSLREVQLATDNFNDNNIIGQGGFGKVYKGILPDQTMVAVKRLRDYHSLGGEAAFLREVQLISVAVHRNLLQLIGFCTTSSERILVYPFMRNLSVANHLRDLKPGDKTLDWATRKRVAFGAARGLEYLHEHCNPKIIHRDLKAANILLDHDFEAVLGDFGLAKLVDANLTHITTQVRGTMGHIAPEYLSTGKSSEKTDVFGYGVTLLELITGQRAVDFARLDEEDDVLLLDHMKKLEREKRLNDMVDRNLETYDLKEVETVIQIALLCTQSLPEQRPTMAEVVSLLGGVGLAERWSRWEQLDEARTQVHSSTTAASHQFAWPDDHSINLQEAMQLSRPR